MNYDYIIVGAGLFGATLAENLISHGKKVLVIEKKTNVGGTCHTHLYHNIMVHKYGAHIFRTDKLWIWNYLSKFTTFIPFVNSPLADYNGALYNLPFNMNTFKQIWYIRTPKEAKEIIAKDKVPCDNPRNFEEWALSEVGKALYGKFIKHYTEKQWGRPCNELPANLMRRIPIRFTFDNNYYDNKPYQGIPKNGYTDMIENMLDGATVMLNTDGKEFLSNTSLNSKVIYTGCIDEFFNYKLGALEYRSLTWRYYTYDHTNVQGNAVINFTSNRVPYTRRIEHRHFVPTQSDVSIVSVETPCEYKIGENEPYYPIETIANKELYSKYYSLAKDTGLIFAGRLGSYKYTDMEQTVEIATGLAMKLL